MPKLTTAKAWFRQCFQSQTTTTTEPEKPPRILRFNLRLPRSGRWWHRLRRLRRAVPVPTASAPPLPAPPVLTNPLPTIRNASGGNRFAFVCEGGVKEDEDDEGYGDEDEGWWWSGGVMEVCDEGEVTDSLSSSSEEEEEEEAGFEDEKEEEEAGSKDEKEESKAEENTDSKASKPNIPQSSAS